MSRFEYKTVDTSTLEGLKLAERLHTSGWKTIRVGLFIIQFERPVPRVSKTDKRRKHTPIEFSENCWIIEYTCPNSPFIPKAIAFDTENEALDWVDEFRLDFGPVWTVKITRKGGSKVSRPKVG